MTTILCLASHFKGVRLLETLKGLGCRVLLITRPKLADEPWPMHVIDERFLLPDLGTNTETLHAVSYLARTRRIDRILAMDEYDTPVGAMLREHLRIPGMGETTVRYFRDKLAMRVRALEAGFHVPDFIHVLNYDDLRYYLEHVSPPWVLKPRSEASAMGIRKLHTAEAFWRTLDGLGDKQSFFLLEQFVPGDVYHVDSLIWDREPVFTAVSKYGQPPMSVYQGGGVFATRTVDHKSPERKALEALNRKLLDAFGMVRGVTHGEFIHSHADGQFYFLEIAARVGGANIDLMIEHATGVNLWSEWAKLEVAEARKQPYTPPKARRQHAGILTCLSREAYPDLSSYNAPEVAWRLHKEHHAGLIVASAHPQRVEELLAHYGDRLVREHMASAPPKQSVEEMDA